MVILVVRLHTFSISVLMDGLFHFSHQNVGMAPMWRYITRYAQLGSAEESPKREVLNSTGNKI